MEKLMKPAEYAQELGISRQAVYAKIKKGILLSKSVDGKLYIVVKEDTDNKSAEIAPSTVVKKKQSSNLEEYKALLDAKDETIAVLKETVVDLKESNNQISTTLRGEIDLLKDAFYEMRTLYAHQLEYKKQEPIEESILEEEKEEEMPEEVIEIFTQEEQPQEKWIGIKKFFKIYNITKEKNQTRLTKQFKKAYKGGDERLMKIENKLKINLNKNYEDILD